MKKLLQSIKDAILGVPQKGFPVSEIKGTTHVIRPAESLMFNQWSSMVDHELMQIQKEH